MEKKQKELAENKGDMKTRPNPKLANLWCSELSKTLFLYRWAPEATSALNASVAV